MCKGGRKNVVKSEKSRLGGSTALFFPIDARKLLMLSECSDLAWRAHANGRGIVLRDLADGRVRWIVLWVFDFNNDRELSCSCESLLLPFA